MKRLLVLAPITEGKKVSYTVRRILEEGKKKFSVDTAEISKTVLRVKSDGTPEIKCGKKDLSKYDYVIPRIDSPRASYGYNIISFLDSIGMNKPYPAKTVMIGHNKFMTLIALRKAGVRVPDTVMVSSVKEARKVLETFKYPLLIKLVTSFGGEGVFYISSRESAESVIKTLQLMNIQMIIEEFVPNAGEDIRGFVVGGKVIASMKRVAKEGEYRANVHLGGKATPFELTKEMEEICVKAAEATGAKICAIDMLQDKVTGKPYVIEVNTNPGIQGIEGATGKNIAKEIIDFAYSEC